MTLSAGLTYTVQSPHHRQDLRAGQRTAPAGTLDAFWPAALTAMYVMLGADARRASSARKLSGEQKNSTYAFWYTYLRAPDAMQVSGGQEESDDDMQYETLHHFVPASILSLYDARIV